MLLASIALLTATQTRLMSQLPLLAHQCGVELENQVPANVGDHYYAVSESSITPGPRHASSGGTIDINIALTVTLYSRIGNTARDRTRNLFLDMSKGHSARLDAVISLLDMNYDVLADANTLLAGTPLEEGAFHEPLRQWTPDRLRAITADPFDATTAAQATANTLVVLARGITFQRARFLMVR